MKAYRLISWKKRGELCEVPVPEPGPNEVLIKIGGAGACHSDLHIMEHYDETHPYARHWPLPMTLGHENAGWIESLGANVDGLEIGQAVVVSPVAGCGRCKNCADGWDNYCYNMGASPGLGRDGGLAEYMSVPASTLVPLRSLEPWQAAPLTDAGLTSYHVINQALPVRDPAGSVVVIGIGGLGHMAVSILKATCGAQVIAVDRSEKARKLAEELGADVCLHSDETTYESILEATRGLGAKAVLDFVGIDQTMALAASITAPMGKVVVAGLGGGVFEFKEGAIRFGCSMQMTLGGSKAELIEVVALAESGRLETRYERFPLEEVQAVYDKIERGEVVGRAVIVPHED